MQDYDKSSKGLIHHHDDPGLLKLFGGRDAVIESPLIVELLAERTHKNLLTFLEARFGSVPQDVVTSLQAIEDLSKLDEMVALAAMCPDLETFRARLRP